MLPFAAMLPQAAPAWANPAAPDERIAALIMRQREMLIEAGVGNRCRGAPRGDEIVVCAEREFAPDPPPPPRRLIDIPNVLIGAPPPGMGVGIGVTVRACFLQKCPKKVVFIDLAAIPEAPPGSDADRIGRGEIADR